ncbi:MAG: efflux RND transporter periplasmic adaptor subunit [Proteobacteria bacterium]|nr:efflux RND transporter periplasmic adaptor subunit [Pseudomonadota bacterium]
MTNNSPDSIPLDQRRGTLPRALAVAVVVVAAATLFSLVSCSPNSDEKPAGSETASNVTLTADQRQHIRLYTVASSKYHKAIETTGVIDFDNDQATSVLAPFSGPVSRLLVSPGDQVKQGDALAVIDSPDFAAAISAYRKARATAETTRRLAAMDKDLLQHNGVARREEEQAETDAVSAEADREAALQALVSLNVDPHTIKEIQRGRPIPKIEGTIRAPIAGTVVEKLITPGELLQAGTTPCFMVADLSRVWVMAQIFDSDLGSVSLGDKAEVLTGVSSSGFPGAVTSISALVNPDTRSVVARVAVDNPKNLLKKQMYVRVRIEAHQESTGLLVPVSAVLRDDENLPFVYVVQRDGSFARQHVTLGYRSGDRYDISAGLRAGQRIVIDGALFIQFMQSQ